MMHNEQKGQWYAQGQTPIGIYKTLVEGRIQNRWTFAQIVNDFKMNCTPNDMEISQFIAWLNMTMKQYTANDYESVE